MPHLKLKKENYNCRETKCQNKSKQSRRHKYQKLLLFAGSGRSHPHCTRSRHLTRHFWSPEGRTWRHVRWSFGREPTTAEKCSIGTAKINEIRISHQYRFSALFLISSCQLESIALQNQTTAVNVSTFLSSTITVSWMARGEKQCVGSGYSGNTSPGAAASIMALKYGIEAS